jgi:hypothetical protein
MEYQQTQALFDTWSDSLIACFVSGNRDNGSAILEAPFAYIDVKRNFWNTPSIDTVLNTYLFSKYSNIGLMISNTRIHLPEVGVEDKYTLLLIELAFKCK